ncbi:MAG: hypothetical protein CV045_13510 [Cyanobacteria bacterium M5B4]|nr:MAG: hypothetical protein CV045_13510 [Cyanobacteria bacterium M5B4]
MPEIIVEGINGFRLREASLTNDFVDAIAKTTYDPQTRRACGEQACTTITTKWAWHTVSPEVFARAYHTAIQHYQTRSRRQRIGYLYTGMFGWRVREIKQRIRAGVLKLRGSL